MKKKNSSKDVKLSKTKQVPVVVELPTNPVDMENYVEKNRTTINDMLVESFDYAVRKNFGGIEIFSFKNSNYVVIVNRKDFKDNLQNIFDYSLEHEQFETCAKAKKVIELLDKYSFFMSYKKRTQK